MTPIDIRPADLDTVRRILSEHVPAVEVLAFGSRVAWNARETSDLDLALMTDQPLGIDRTAGLRAAFTDSDLPFRVDIVDWATASESFRTRIRANHAVIRTAHSGPRSPSRRVSVPEQAVGVHAWAAGTLAVRPAEQDDGRWKEVPLGSLVEIYDGPHATPKKTSTGPVFLGVSNLASGRLDLSTTEHLSEDDYLRWTRRVEPLPNDVVFSYETRIGEAARIPEGLHACLGRRMGLLRAKDGAADPRFLLYAFLGNRFQETLRSRTVHGSTVDRILLSDMADFPITVPRSLDEQRAIAHILGTLDDKIELNRRMNATLEAMARALFRSWFVDFDPVRAKMQGRDTGLPKEIADLFPDRLVDSDVGEIPEGWKVSEIGAEVDAVGGATPSTKEPAYWDGGQHYWATPKDLSKLLSPVLLETDRKITDAGAQRISSGLLPPGTVLLSSRAPIGYLAITEVPTAINQGFIAMTCRKRLPAQYVLSWCYENLEHIQDISGGSTFAEISKKAFRPLPVVVPPKTILRVYDEPICSLHERVVSNTRESALLASLRDALLPKLVSGELRVSVPETTRGAVEQAVKSVETTARRLEEHAP